MCSKYKSMSINITKTKRLPQTSEKGSFVQKQRLQHLAGSLHGFSSSPLPWHLRKLEAFPWLWAEQQSTALLRITGKLQTSAERSQKRVMNLFYCGMHCSYVCSAGGVHHVCYFRTGVFWPALSSEVHYMLPYGTRIAERTTVQVPLSFWFLCPF